MINIDEDLKKSVKRDIQQFYLTGKTTLKSITEHYNLKSHTVGRIVTELIEETIKNHKSRF